MTIDSFVGRGSSGGGVRTSRGLIRSIEPNCSVLMLTRCPYGAFQKSSNAERDLASPCRFRFLPVPVSIISVRHSRKLRARELTCLLALIPISTQRHLSSGAYRHLSLAYARRVLPAHQ